MDIYGHVEAEFKYKIVEIKAAFSINNTEMQESLSNVTDVEVC